MLVIGEKINVLTNIVYESIVSKDLSPIVSLAIQQVESGAEALDVNIGPDIAGGEQIMKELVGVIQQNVAVPLCLNGTPGMIEAGLGVHRGRAIINGVTGDRERMGRLLFLAGEFNAGIIGMALPERGYASDVNEGCSIAMDIVEEAARQGIMPSDIYLDPVLASFSMNPAALTGATGTVRLFKETFPGTKTLVGLSNISQGLKGQNRSIMNSSALGVLVGAGLDAAILNPLDRLVMETAKTVKLLCAGGIYCDAYLCG
ncbi:5-methyltetrahydrofolate:corrinoid/iron-sulfur protein co-methyltransferase [bacterium BMS3Abin07]|nr:5-methyltetrahydrofolate:corrinoid/iron-sulfur protein co-methyltransferase [bacterium BMS3Abin07]